MSAITYMQLMLAVESINQLEFDLELPPPSSKPVKPVEATSLTRYSAEKVAVDFNDIYTTNVILSPQQPPIPYTYYKVYVDSVLNTKPCVSLAAAGFPGSVCKTLTRLGFQSPTLVQASSWPIVGQDRGLTLIVSPPNTGKTLSYLLPLVTNRELCPSTEEMPRPRVVVVVHSSWGALAVHTRAVQLMSAQSAHRRFRCIQYYVQFPLTTHANMQTHTHTHKGLAQPTKHSERYSDHSNRSNVLIRKKFQATVQVLNGVEVLVSTPDYFLYLVENTVAQLDSLAYLVYTYILYIHTLLTYNTYIHALLAESFHCS